MTHLCPDQRLEWLQKKAHDVHDSRQRNSGDNGEMREVLLGLVAEIGQMQARQVQAIVHAL